MTGEASWKDVRTVVRGKDAAGRDEGGGKDAARGGGHGWPEVRGGSTRAKPRAPARRSAAVERRGGDPERQRAREDVADELRLAEPAAASVRAMDGERKTGEPWMANAFSGPAWHHEVPPPLR